MSAIEVLQIPAELDAMRALYLEAKPRRVLEIGCWQGGTLREWLASEPELVVAVDVDHQRVELYDDWTTGQTELVVLTGSSQDGEIVRQIRERGPYDWVFVDGDHDEWFAIEDTLLALDVASSDAHILIHDIVDCYSAGPALAFARAGEQYESWTYVEGRHPWGHGIGVVRIA